MFSKLPFFIAGMMGAACALAHPTYTAEAQVYFSPDGGAQEAIVSKLDHAKHSVFVQAYLFNNPTLAKALEEAARRGVKVEMNVDRKVENSNLPLLKQLEKAGVKIMVDDKHPSSHNKTMVIDGKWVVAGSYNFVNKAEKKNAENMLILKSPELAEQYAADWHKHRQHSRRLEEHK